MSNTPKASLSCVDVYSALAARRLYPTTDWQESVTNAYWIWITNRAEREPFIKLPSDRITKLENKEKKHERTN